MGSRYQNLLRNKFRRMRTSSAKRDVRTNIADKEFSFFGAIRKLCELKKLFVE